MDSKLSRQLERVLDEGTGDRRSVIVRVASPNETRQAILEVASHAFLQRNMALSARDCLPAPLDQIRPPKSGRRSTKARAQLQNAEPSFASQVAALPVRSDTRETFQRRAREFFEPLLHAEMVKKANEESANLHGKDVGAFTNTFWTSKSMLLDIAVEDLQVLPTVVPQIVSIYPNRVLKVPPLVEAKNVPDLVLENKASAWGARRIGGLAAWGAYAARGQGVKVGLLDTGVDAEHPDLKGKVVGWAEFDDQGNEVAGSQPHDSDRHGTHCAGTIVGGNASGQWIGVAPEATLAAALVLNGGSGTDAQVLAGIDWLAEQGVDVISMSLGGLTLDPETPDTYSEAILTCLRLGIPVVTAIGNEGHQTTGSPGNDLFAFAVGATDHLDRTAGFSGGRTHIIRSSNFIPPQSLPLVYSKPEVSAPGVAITSSIPGAAWASFNGTSMATPHVAGAIALLLSVTSIKEEVAANERGFLLQDLIIGSVEELGEAGQDHRYGFGRVDVLRAIGFAHERGFRR